MNIVVFVDTYGYIQAYNSLEDFKKLNPGLDAVLRNDSGNLLVTSGTVNGSYDKILGYLQSTDVRKAS